MVAVVTEDRLKRRELKKLMRPVPRFFVSFSREVLAAALWAYGEDELADRALSMSDADHAHIQVIAAHFENPQYALPVETKIITDNHVNALAAITYFEGRTRELARARRRPEKLFPARFDATGPKPASERA